MSEAAAITPGRAAYEKHRAAFDALDPEGWDDLADSERAAWEAVAKAACEAHGHAVGLAGLAAENSELRGQLDRRYDENEDLRDRLAAAVADRDAARSEQVAIGLDYDRVRARRNEHARDIGVAVGRLGTAIRALGQISDGTRGASDSAAIAERALASIGTPAPYPPPSPELDEARAVVRDMLAVLAEYGEGGQDNDQIVQWRTRAGLGES